MQHEKSWPQTIRCLKVTVWPVTHGVLASLSLSVRRCVWWDGGGTLPWWWCVPGTRHGRTHTPASAAWRGTSASRRPRSASHWSGTTMPTDAAAHRTVNPEYVESLHSTPCTAVLQLFNIALNPDNLEPKDLLQLVHMRTAFTSSTTI